MSHDYEGFTLTLPPQYAPALRDLVLMLKHVHATRYVPGREQMQVAFTHLVGEEWFDNHFLPLLRAAFEGRFPAGTKGLETVKPISSSLDAYRGDVRVVHADLNKALTRMEEEADAELNDPGLWANRVRGLGRGRRLLMMAFDPDGYDRHYEARP